MLKKNTPDFNRCKSHGMNSEKTHLHNKLTFTPAMPTKMILVLLNPKMLGKESIPHSQNITPHLPSMDFNCFLPEGCRLLKMESQTNKKIFSPLITTLNRVLGELPNPCQATSTQHGTKARQPFRAMAKPLFLWLVQIHPASTTEATEQVKALVICL